MTGDSATRCPKANQKNASSETFDEVFNRIMTRIMGASGLSKTRVKKKSKPLKTLKSR